MEETSKGSKKWQEDIYWNHFHCIHFISHLYGDFQKHLAIPRKFACKLKKKLPESVVLRGPGGFMWNVRLSMEGDTLYFNDGWQDFVIDHSLQENDTLLFEYNRESRFDVFLFEQSSSCEIESSYFVKRCLDVDATDESRDQTKRKNREVIQIDDDAEKEQKTARNKRVSYVRYLSNRRPVTKEEKDTTLQQARAAANPDSVVVVLQPKHVYVKFTMGFSHKWMGKHISSDDKFLILRMMEKMWRISLTHVQILDSWMLIFGLENFELGWENFALGNYLEESDVCVFNPAGRNKDGIFMADVSIFRVVEEVVAPIGVKS
ncbi:hypothetical protein SLEP1_g16832 [Rubroshorea leprosula]|uniref:TF-B3 domain-containing protein n=2 Tax=Rubroshorea leprosula TaxID=152421 RepID=A0AAV5IS90_9ROSI|nr:hypothetical protein SLEP1_g16832 [Rubroshorea leprosula]